MKKIFNVQDVVVLSHNHRNKKQAGRIGFIIEKYLHDEDAKEEDLEWRYDVQFAFDPNSEKDTAVFNQLQVGEEDIICIVPFTTNL